MPGSPLLVRYLLRRWWRMSLAFALVFVAVLMLLYAAEVMGDIAGGEIPVSMLGWQLLLHLPEVLTTVLPLAMVMAVLLTRQQMQRDREWAMLRGRTAPAAAAQRSRPLYAGWLSAVVADWRMA